MAPSCQGRRPKSLSHGRPLSVQARQSTSAGPAARSIASKHTRRVIRQHHTLQKKLAQAKKAKDTALEAQIEEELAAQGGLDLYQEASVNGANRLRGGDTSRKLIEFIGSSLGKRHNKLKMLDVGALTLDTAAKRCGAFDITRIDLVSREKGILQQDFMARPLPPDQTSGDSERFDIVCLSLVLNYVPDAQGRGDMLKRVIWFLREPASTDVSRSGETENRGSGERDDGEEFHPPALFLVLPASCIMNSRYLNQSRLEAIMDSLGFELGKQTITEKLAYQLWHWNGRSAVKKHKSFSKTVINPGRTRNNFAIILNSQGID